MSYIVSKYLRALYELKGIRTPIEIQKKLGEYSKGRAYLANHALVKLRQRGMVERVNKGKYKITPKGAILVITKDVLTTLER